MEKKKIAIDTNILLFATDKNHELNEFCYDLICRGVNKEFELYIADKTLYEYFAVLSNTFCENNLPQAKELFDYYLYHSDISILTSSKETSTIVSRLLEKKDVKGKYIHDIVIIAILLENDIDIICTDNVKDFIGFEGIDVVSPRDDLLKKQ